jgi:dienelactone hydrolase
MARILLLIAALALIHTAAAQQMTLNETQLSAGVNSTSLTTQRVNYTADIPMNAYLAYDNSSTAARPAIIIIPDWDGIGGYEEWRAKLLANLGYVAMVADLYGANVSQGPAMPTSVRGAFVTQLLSNPALLRSRMIAAIDTVKTLPVTNSSQIAAIGYCLGGSAIIELARAYPNGTDGLLGVVGFHAGQLNTTGSRAVPGNPIKISLHNGFLDPSVTGKPEFIAEMNAANVTWEFTDYSQTLHSFTNPATMPSANAAYNLQADKRSWAALRSFLEDIFGYVPASNIYTYAMGGSQQQ